MGARQWIESAKADLLGKWTESIDKAVMLTRDAQNAKRDAETLAGVYNDDAENVSGDAKVYAEKVSQLRSNEINRILNDIKSYEEICEKESALFSTFDNESRIEEFRTELLKHLAGNLVIKEHRLRYQKEQFDRFACSLQQPQLKNKNITLAEFATNYAELIEIMTDSSHSWKCPKIEASYLKHGEDTIRPFNANVFFYMFQGSKAGRTWAQWMLASARYPQEKMRRAYMHMFV